MDERVNEGIASYEEALKKAGVNYLIFMYEGTQQAFHNDTAPTRYNEEAQNFHGKGLWTFSTKS